MNGGTYCVDMFVRYEYGRGLSDIRAELNIGRTRSLSDIWAELNIGRA